MTDLRKAAEMALKVLNVGSNEVIPNNYEKMASEAARRLNDALSNLSTLEWFDAPTKTEWGEMMVKTSIEIDANHYFDVYCERSQKENVELLLGVKKREWAGLSRDEVDYCFEQNVVRKFDQDGTEQGFVSIYQAAQAIETELKEKNT
jgi:hypothetical protein